MDNYLIDVTEFMIQLGDWANDMQLISVFIFHRNQGNLEKKLYLTLSNSILTIFPTFLIFLTHMLLIVYPPPIGGRYCLSKTASISVCKESL